MRKLIALTACVFFMSCSGQQSEPSQPQAGSAVTAMSKMANLATDPFAQMSFTFEGNPPAGEIRARVDKVLPMYGLEVTDANRNLAGHTLVALRKEHAHSEMAILDKMLNTPAEGAQFQEAAARIAAQMNQ